MVLSGGTKIKRYSLGGWVCHIQAKPKASGFNLYINRHRAHAAETRDSRGLIISLVVKVKVPRIRVLGVPHAILVIVVVVRI